MNFWNDPGGTLPISTSKCRRGHSLSFWLPIPSTSSRILILLLTLSHWQVSQLWFNRGDSSFWSPRHTLRVVYHNMSAAHSSVKLVVGCDHAAVPQKDELVAFLKAQGFQVLDKGVYTPDRVDYPDVAAAVCGAVVLSNKEEQAATTLGILLCGTGIGMSIAANKIEGVRAALVHDHFTAKMARMHNDANVLCLGARTTGIEVLKECALTFLSASFEGGRHGERVAKITALEQLPRVPHPTA